MSLSLQILGEKEQEQHQDETYLKPKLNRFSPNGRETCVFRLSSLKSCKGNSCYFICVAESQIVDHKLHWNLNCAVVRSTVKPTYSASVLVRPDHLGCSRPSSQISPTDHCEYNYEDDEDKKAFRSRSAASPGGIAPLVTRSSRWGRVSLTLG